MANSILTNPTTGQVFFDAIEAAKNAGKEEEIDSGLFGTKFSKWRGAFLSSYTAQEYDQMNCNLFFEKRAGFALKERDIVSIFKHPELKAPALDTMIPAATQQGGNRLDCFAPLLPKLYGRFGFKPVAKIRFDQEYAPKDWNYARDGQPDIVYMVYDPSIAPTPISEMAQRIEKIIDELAFSTYEEAVSAQLNAL